MRVKLSENKMLNTTEAATFLGYGVATLKKWRLLKKGPVYYKGKGGSIFYEPADLRTFRARIATLVRVEPQPRKRSAR